MHTPRVPNRREFVRASVAAAGAMSLLPALSSCAGKDSAKPLKVLILGGTGFLGPHMVRSALDRGHEVTIFNRGKTNPQLFPEVEKLEGDRDGNLKALEGHRWDVVLDNSGYVPRHVRDSAQLLKDAADHYLFTSTAGLYKAMFENAWPEGFIDEDAQVAELPEPGSEEVGRYYGQLKGACEEEVRAAFPGRFTITRPGLIVGPGDGTDRFTYYPARIDRGGEMMAFGSAGDPVQYVDARDLADFSLHCVEQRLTNTFHAIGPKDGMTMGQMLEGIAAAIGAQPELTWVPGPFLAESGVPPVSLMPWVDQEGPYHGLARLSPVRCFANGMAFRPFADTVRDTLAWWKEQPEERRSAMRGGLRGGGLAGPASMDQQMKREAEILAAWKARPAG